MANTKPASELIIELSDQELVLKEELEQQYQKDCDNAEKEIFTDLPAHLRQQVVDTRIIAQASHGSELRIVDKPQKLIDLEKKQDLADYVLGQGRRHYGCGKERQASEVNEPFGHIDLDTLKELHIEKTLEEELLNKEN